MNFGEAIRKLRQAHGLKAYELAQKARIERTYISKIERHNNLPSFFVMKMISDSLGSPELLDSYIKVKCASFSKRQKPKGVRGNIKN